MPPEVVDVREQPGRGALARAEPNPTVDLVHGDEVDLRAALVPVAFDPGGDREVRNPLPTPLLVDLPGPTLERETLDVEFFGAN